jgi:hypothetical protein
MVSLTLATSQSVTINGVECVGPVTMVGDSFSVLGETLTEGSWLVGLVGGSVDIVQLASLTWWQVDMVYPLAIAAGLLVALRGLRMA